jgi:hypothetical protein
VLLGRLRKIQPVGIGLFVVDNKDKYTATNNEIKQMQSNLVVLKPVFNVKGESRRSAR